ncbi:hypothetical protein BDN72DRAFT_22667 [Pluteus cervinus]|uniref:Uncharacterized protein n=1 Tax=Pluteus cervinus TaxID=181527 RepID=A0ACD3BGJ7_9AGAR|nr:hypothetical protein BDN72DRAFT_22667 [Pluteus cervinus]
MSLRYNISWVERTFSSSSVAESLLRPERDAGNISPRDYDAAVHFFSGRHKFYGFLGGVFAAPLVLAFRKPSWSAVRTYGLMTAATVGGFSIGRAFCLNAHVKFVRSIEDPVGFARAFSNIQQGTGVPRGPEIVRTFEGTSEEPPSIEMTNNESWGAPVGTSEPSTPASTAPTTKPKSKWDEIRSANSSAKGSLWDKVRESHEKTRIASNQEPEDLNNPKPQSDAQRRKDEQLAFDALLEKERNVSVQIDQDTGRS